MIAFMLLITIIGIFSPVHALGGGIALAADYQYCQVTSENPYCLIDNQFPFLLENETLVIIHPPQGEVSLKLLDLDPSGTTDTVEYTVGNNPQQTATVEPVTLQENASFTDTASISGGQISKIMNGQAQPLVVLFKFAPPLPPISILAVIDTDAIEDSISSGGLNPSTDSSHPSLITPADSEYLIVSSTGAVSGQVTADLELQGQIGQSVKFYAKSASDNSDDAIIVYGISPSGSSYCLPGAVPTTAFSFPVVPNFITLDQAAQPSSNPPNYNGLPPRFNKKDFHSFDTSITNTTDGKAEEFCIEFAIYEHPDGNSSQDQLLGYFYWIPSLTIEGN